jgi:hypothetical protein
VDCGGVDSPELIGDDDSMPALTVHFACNLFFSSEDAVRRNSENGVDETSGGTSLNLKSDIIIPHDGPGHLQIQRDRIFPRHGRQFDHIYPKFTLPGEITRLANFIKFS